MPDRPDAAAVEAAREWIAGDMTAMQVNRDDLARIITECYAEQRDKSVHVGKYDCRFCGRRHSNGWYCKARLTAERAVRERLVDACKGALRDYEQVNGMIANLKGFERKHPFTITPRYLSAALADAKTLEVDNAA